MNLAFAIVALGGCGADLPPIEVTELTPRWAYNGEPAKIMVVGRNFYPSVTASSFAEPQVESQFRAWVETDPPTEADYAVPTSLTTLEVQIPEGSRSASTGSRSNPRRHRTWRCAQARHAAHSATVDDGRSW
jgi:hypothetical protein